MIFINNCKDCKIALVGDNMEQYSSFVRLKKYIKNAGKLIQPSQNVMCTFIKCEENFNTFTELNTILTMKICFASIFNAQLESASTNLDCCDMRNAQAEMFLVKHLRKRLRIHLRQLAQGVNGVSSKTCTVIILANPAR